MFYKTICKYAIKFYQNMIKQMHYYIFLNFIVIACLKTIFAECIIMDKTTFKL